DNADRRLTPLAHRLGLADDARLARVEEKERRIAETVRLLESTHDHEGSMAKRLRRPETTWDQIAARRPELADVPAEVRRQVTYDVKYAGYVARQDIDVARQERLAARRIPEAFDYADVEHLRMEAREKLASIRPRDLAQASRISGITPADVAVLMVYLK
ncbi:MAG TPA: tRNA uridine-5-carboxymethylaminomethyl(34) synthesis enzyme MnmG, partial [Planctomycetaceae bacterium]|nr:tRNA uridine-5-carboxymethylaminomethyl(34) synthesis enzyme MnmG [Planctomycetaceae bacterium]